MKEDCEGLNGVHGHRQARFSATRQPRGSPTTRPLDSPGYTILGLFDFFQKKKTTAASEKLREALFAAIQANDWPHLLIFAQQKTSYANINGTLA